MTTSTDYLWECSGQPDSEIQQLEAALRPLRHSRPAPVFPAVPVQRANSWFELPSFRWSLTVAAAVFFAFAGFRLFHFSPPPPAPLSAWLVISATGAPRIGTTAVHENLGLPVGQELSTDSRSQLTIRDEKTGEIDVDPDTRLRISSTGATGERLSLDRGTIHAYIWRNPGEFVIDTPSATAVDMGCAYTLHVDAAGDGLLRTTKGWVGFKLGSREAFIPAGAACATHRRTGPDTPYFEDASQPFRAALARFDSGDSDALKEILSLARKRDALTLWHLLTRVAPEDRGRVYERLAQLVPPPTDVTREGIFAGNRAMLDSWWNELDLGDISLWRYWLRNWVGSERK